VPVVTSWLTSVQFPFIGGTIGLSTVLLIIFLALTLVVGLWLVWRLFDWISDVYAVTNERLIKQHGIVTHNFKDIPIKQVHTVEVHQKKLAARFLRYGTLEMESLASFTGSAAAAQSGGYMRPNPRVLDPYINPRDPYVDTVGVEKWFSVPDPIRIQRTIEKATEALDTGRGVEP